jgi:arabinofuranan 3-O-arabinosyltransferase
MEYVTNALPYIMKARENANNSIAGVGLYYGLPAWLNLLLRALFALLGAGSMWLLYRYYRTREPLLWMLTSSGVLLTTSWLISALGQAYYSMMLFPFLMTVVLQNSVIRNWPAWLAIYGFLSPDIWWVWHWPTTGRFLAVMKVTYGWSLLMIVVFVVLYFRYLDAKASDDGLEHGIDPLWMTAARQGGE